jgi:hypothetical protein
MARADPEYRQQPNHRIHPIADLIKEFFSRWKHGSLVVYLTQHIGISDHQD